MPCHHFGRGVVLQRCPAPKDEALTNVRLLLIYRPGPYRGVYCADLEWLLYVDWRRSGFAQIRDIKLCAGSTDRVQRSFSGAVCRGATYLSP